MTPEDKVVFRCRDLGHDCPWQISGDSADEILPKIAEHGREQHDVSRLDEADERKIRSAIRHREAA